MKIVTDANGNPLEVRATIVNSGGMESVVPFEDIKRVYEQPQGAIISHYDGTRTAIECDYRKLMDARDKYLKVKQ